MDKNNFTSNISFCDKIVQNLVSDDVKQQILDKLLNNYNVSITQKDCVLLKPNYCNNLKKNDHVITTKSNGNSYYLFLTKYNNVNTCFYIDKKVKEGFNLPRILILKQRFENDVFNDTLMEGELIRTKNRNWLFLFSNIYVYKANIINDNMIEKINKIYYILTNEYQNDIYLDPCKYEVKKIFNFNQYNDLIDNFIPNLPYSVKGIIFHPVNKKYNNLLYIFDRKMNDKKKQENVVNTTGINYSSNNEKMDYKNEISNFNENILKIDFKDIILKFKIVSTETPDIFNLHILNADKYVLFGMENIQTLKCSKFVKKIFKEGNNNDIIVNCKYSEKFNKWEPISVCKEGNADNLERLKDILSF